MKDDFWDICNCPECGYFSSGKPHCCGLPKRITERDKPYIRGAVRTCHCVNPRLWEFYERLGAGK